jgi:hydrogenase maturation protease
MKPQLVIGLGNPLMGDDGVGCAVAERLADDPRLPESVDVMNAGTDLLRCAGRLDARRRVVIVDAVEDNGVPGDVILLDEEDAELDLCQQHAHLLSTVEAIRLLKMTSGASFLLLGVTISRVTMEPSLSPAVAARLPAILSRVLEEIGRAAESGSCEQ